MEQQRRLRLGDILDDYCPRERRVTNHAIVAMIEDDVKQTRCTTCDAEHVYKGGKAPRRKKAETTTALYKEVLANITDEDAAPVLAMPGIITPAAPASAEIAEAAIADAAIDAVESEPEDGENLAQPEQYARDAMDDPDDPADPLDPLNNDIQPDLPAPDEGPVHRQLIRAQLPRVEGVKVERQAPEFTIRHNSNVRGGGQNFRGDTRAQGGRPGGTGNGSGARFGRGPQRPAGGGGRGGSNQGFGRGPGGNQPRHGGGNGPRKRGR
jgi:hypothetical protein